jgi:hypothetical protein
MFDLYVNQGLGGTQISTLINNPPYMARKRNGSPWDGPQVLEVLKNPIYMGRPAWGKNSYQTGRRVRKGAEEWVWSEVHVSEWEIVDEAIWHKAQQLRAERWGEVTKGKKMPPRAFTSHLLLTGTAYCGYCGQPLVTKTYSNKRTKADGTTVHDKYEGYTAFEYCADIYSGIYASRMLAPNYHCDTTLNAQEKAAIPAADRDLRHMVYDQLPIDEIEHLISILTLYLNPHAHGFMIRTDTGTLATVTVRELQPLPRSESVTQTVIV